jgi:predicted MFS family arabinose efflux permease
MTRFAVIVGVVQFFFVTTWTAYVIYLPQLAAQAGIERHWVPWILVADQVIFAVTDVATGFWVDKVRSGIARLGGWILGVTAVSCVAFLVMPFAGASPGMLLAAIVVWALTSSALRSPPWALLGRHAAKPSLPWLSTLVLTGTAIASAIAPYLGIALRGVDPKVPFLVSTVTLLVSVGVLVFAERRIPVNEKPVDQQADSPKNIIPIFIALLVLAVGFQIHFSLNSAPGYLKFAPASELPLLMPVFWIGFNLMMFPASMAVKRIGAADLLTLAAALGALGTLASAFAPGKDLLVAAQFVAGGCWGAACVAAYTAAVGFGRGGREGRFLGTLFAVLAVATCARIAISGAGLPALPGFKGMLAWAPQACWLLGAMLLLASRLRR